MFRVFGHENVWVLDGGLPKWRASGYDVESSASSDAILKSSAASEVVEKVYQGQSVSSFLPVYIAVSVGSLIPYGLYTSLLLAQISPVTFKTKFQPHLVWTLDQVSVSQNFKIINSIWFHDHYVYCSKIKSLVT